VAVVVVRIYPPGDAFPYFPSMPASAPPERRQLFLFAGGAVGLILFATLADSLAYTYLTFPRVYDQNWGRLLRTIGYLPFWLLAGAAFYRIGPTLAARRHALLLMAAPTVSGACSELLKLLVRRERPTAAAGAYIFQAFSEHPFSTGRFGMPSGDATVAFAACALLARVWPEARGIWYALAVGCALARVLSRAHFLSDVTAAAILGWVVTDWLWRRYAPTTPAASPPTAT
jgi:membrane-associated phospholipid phosphatase